MTTRLITMTALLAGLSLTATADNRPFTTPLGLWQQTYGQPDGKVHLYHNPDNPYVQELNVSLRAQYQAASVSPNGAQTYPGSGGHTDEWRRLRLGWNAKALTNLKITNIWNMGGVDSLGYYKNGQWYDHGMTHGNLYEANIEYSFSDFTIGAGKILPVILAENRISSSKYKLPELSAVENQLVSDSSFGLWICNDEKKNDLGYYAGIWSNSEKRSRGTWGTWESANANIGLSYKADNLILQNGRIYFDWIHNFDDMDIRAYRYKNVGTKARDIFALYYYGKQGPFELMMEGIWAQNIADYKQGGKTVSPSHLAGLTVMPSWNLSPHVQAVMRYQLGTGSQAICLNKRYASLVDTQGTYVDTYQAVALGFNFYMYADDPARLKIMTMAEYGHSSGSAPGHGFTGWSFIGGVYTNF